MPLDTGFHHWILTVENLDNVTAAGLQQLHLYQWLWQPVPRQRNWCSSWNCLTESFSGSGIAVSGALGAALAAWALGAGLGKSLEALRLLDMQAFTENFLANRHVFLCKLYTCPTTARGPAREQLGIRLDCREC